MKRKDVCSPATLSNGYSSLPSTSPGFVSVAILQSHLVHSILVSLVLGPSKYLTFILDQYLLRLNTYQLQVSVVMCVIMTKLTVAS